ncbi:MAG: Cysteine desulfurase [uncultured Gemmatimonadaceae bacterium]|uniref:Cysteine desulfurase n=1 Tax=uncultured Gemmatimonadaceae bacterium TaxID=246130 RepID=A0A6J4LEG3_9BACT|nr:MAG: Cysteine desulfurase [uncultured Gemmatimonadaceae bacterium]
MTASRHVTAGGVTPGDDRALGARRAALVRAHFPALSRTHNALPVAYFDGPGGTQVPRAVADAVRDYLLHHNGNAHWAFPTSAETDAIVAAARLAYADFLGAAPDEIAFGANMTTLAFHVARALGRTFAPGDEVVVTELDHHANVAPWQALAAERGAVVRVARMDAARGALDVDHLAALVGPRTRVVAVGAASNALGTITDVRGVADVARAAGALTFVDAVHYAPHELVDVAALGCDFLACSPYKFYGPHAGVLWGRRELLAALDVPKVAPAPAHAPDRLETGTPSFEAIAGAAAAVEFLASLGDGPAPGGPRRARLAAAYAWLREHEAPLARRLREGLGSVAGVTLHGPPQGARRTATVSFTVAGRQPRDVAAALADQALFLSHGNFYAATVVERLGLAERGGLVRAGCACYTTEDEVERLIDAVRAVARR